VKNAPWIAVSVAPVAFSMKATNSKDSPIQAGATMANKASFNARHPATKPTPTYKQFCE
jgi:hypothetical protein